MSEPLSFTRNRACQEALLQWHHHLEEHDRGGRAMLRRARAPLDVAFVPAFHRLLHSLRATGVQAYPDSLAAVAGLAAHVRSHQPGPGVAKQMGQGPDGKTAVHETRFRRLLVQNDLVDLYQPMIRVLRLLGGQVDLPRLAEDLYRWEHPEGFVRKQWAYDYYDAAVRPSSRESA